MKCILLFAGLFIHVLLPAQNVDSLVQTVLDSQQIRQMDSIANARYRQFIQDSLFNETSDNAQQLFDQQKYLAAIEVFNKLLNLSAFDRDIYFDIGLCYYKMNNFDKAAFNFNRALKSDSTFKEARYLKAMSMQQRGDLKTVLIELRTLKTQDENYDDLGRKIKHASIILFIASNWYYLIAIAIMLTILIMLVIRKGEQ